MGTIQPDQLVRANFMASMQNLSNKAELMYGRHPDRSKLLKLSETDIRLTMQSTIEDLRSEGSLNFPVQSYDVDSFYEVGDLVMSMRKEPYPESFFCPVYKAVNDNDEDTYSLGGRGKESKSGKDITDYAICQTIAYHPSTDKRLDKAQAFAEIVQDRYPLDRTSPSLQDIRDLAKQHGVEGEIGLWPLSESTAKTLCFLYNPKRKAAISLLDSDVPDGVSTALLDPNC